MAPMIECNTEDKLEYNFYPVNGGIVNFKVRAPNDAHIALTSGPMEAEPMLEVFIGGWKNQRSVIRKNRSKPDVAENETPDVLDAGEFRGFWIRWMDNVVTVGKEGEAAAFLSYQMDEPFPIAFIGLCTGWGACGSWIVEGSDAVSPSAPISCGVGGPACWVAGQGGEVPPSAIEGGMDGETLYIGRAKHEGALIPGKIVPSHGVCYVAWGGGEHPHTEYEVLCEGPGQWLPGTGTDIPGHAFPGGETEEGEPLFIGRASHEGTLTVGKIQPSHGVCYIPYGGQEMAFSEFEIFCTL